MAINIISASRNSEHLTHPKYRADIDGLRGIAVLSVVGFHAFPHFIKGGFIGVDIFFIISGFLISSIIFSNLEHNSFSLGEFYLRRIIRIFPALLLVMIANLAFGWFVLYSDEYRQLGKHLAGGAEFLSNFILWKESGYFDNSAETKPLLHLWSLAIEEQFYIFWPLLLAFVWKRKWSFITITAAVAAVSFAVNIYTINQNPTAAFYLPIPRFWELMIGGLLAYIALHKPHLNSQHKNVQSILGVVLLALGLVLLNKYREFPGWWALLPTLGAFFIISAGQNGWLNKHILSNKLFVWVGLISYPLYLWHWSLLSFAHIIENSVPSHKIRIGAIMASVVLSWLTVRLIEKPIRFGKTKKTILAGCLVLLMGCGLLVGNLVNMEVLKSRNNNPDLQSIFSATIDFEYPNKLIKNTLAPENVYSLESKISDTTLLIGDSHIEQYSPRIVDLIKNNRTANTAIFVTDGGCPPIPEVFEDLPAHKGCKENRNYGLEMIKQNNVKVVIIGACWNCYFIQESIYPKTKDIETSDYYFLINGKKEYFRNGRGKILALQQLENFLGNISKTKKVYLLLDNPMDKRFDPRSLIEGSRFEEIKISKMPSQSIELNPSEMKLREELINIANRLGVGIIDPFQKLCTEKNCDRLTNDGKFIYKDSNHLSSSYVRENSSYLDKAFF